MATLNTVSTSQVEPKPRYQRPQVIEFAAMGAGEGSGCNTGSSATICNNGTNATSGCTTGTGNVP